MKIQYNHFYKIFLFRYLFFPSVFLAVFVFLIAANPGSPVENKGGKKQRQVTLKEFIITSSASHPRFQMLLAERAAVKFERIIKSPDSNFVIDLAGEYGISLDSTDPDSTASVSLKKLFLGTGTQAGAEYSITSGPDSTGTTTQNYQLEFSIIQPVLNNSFGRSYRINEKIYDLEADIARYQILEAYEEFLSALVKTYFQWYSNYSRLEIARSTHRDDLRVLRDMRARARKNIALPVDVNKVKLKSLYSEAAVTRMENEYENTLEFIYAAMGIHEGEKDRENIAPELPENYATLENTFLEELAAFQKKSRTYNLLGLLEKRAHYFTVTAEDDLLPSANLLLRYSLDSDSPALNTNQNSDVFIGFSISYPFGNTQAKARHSRTLVYEKRQKFHTQTTKLQIETDLENLYRRIQTVIRLVSLARAQLKTARDIYSAESRYFQRGRITLNDLLRASNEVERLKFTVDDLKVERDTLFVEWLRLSDRLVIRLNAKNAKENNLADDPGLNEK
ncbi:MAG: TolC family protein [Leptospirales bacterium]